MNKTISYCEWDIFIVDTQWPVLILWNDWKNYLTFKKHKWEIKLTQEETKIFEKEIKMLDAWGIKYTLDEQIIFEKSEIIK